MLHRRASAAFIGLSPGACVGCLVGVVVTRSGRAVYHDGEGGGIQEASAGRGPAVVSVNEWAVFFGECRGSIGRCGYFTAVGWGAGIAMGVLRRLLCQLVDHVKGVSQQG